MDITTKLYLTNLILCAVAGFVNQTEVVGKYVDYSKIMYKWILISAIMAPVWAVYFIWIH